MLKLLINAVLFVALDVGVVIKLLIQSVQKSLVPNFNLYPVFFPVFLARFKRFFITSK